MKNEKKIIFVHQDHHVGGGQVYVNQLIWGFQQEGYKTELLEGLGPLDLILKLARSKTKIVLWSVYETITTLPYVASFFLGKINIINIYGIWKLESRSHFINENVENKREGERTQTIVETKLLIKQFIYFMFSTELVHLSKYARSLFYKVSLFHLFKNKKQVIGYGGVNEKMFRKVDERTKEKLRKKIGMNKNDIILLMVGRVEKRKNYSDGLKVLKSLQKLVPNKNIFLYLVLSYGKFNDYRHMYSLFQEVGDLRLGKWVRVMTAIEYQDLADIYQVSDAYLMMSTEFETFGLVTLESLSCGIPVFGYKVCATPEIVSNSKHKTLFKVGNTLGIAKAIAKYLNLSKTAKKTFITDLQEKIEIFSWRKTVARIIQTLGDK